MVENGWKIELIYENFTNVNDYMINIVYDFVEDETCPQESKLSRTVTEDRIFFFTEHVVLLSFFPTVTII